MKIETPNQIPPGQTIIQAIICSAALDGAANVNGRAIFFWHEDAAQRIEQALAQAGFALTSIGDEEANAKSA